MLLLSPSRPQVQVAGEVADVLAPSCLVLEMVKEPAVAVLVIRCLGVTLSVLPSQTSVGGDVVFLGEEVQFGDQPGDDGEAGAFNFLLCRLKTLGSLVGFLLGFPIALPAPSGASVK